MTTAPVPRRSSTIVSPWIAGAGCAAAIGGTALQAGLLSSGESDELPWPLIQNGSFAIGATVLGAILLRHPAARLIGTVLCVCGVVGGTSVLLSALGNLALALGWPSAIALHLLAEILWPVFAFVPLFLPLVYPSGLLAGPVWRVAAALMGVVVAGFIIATATLPSIPAGQSGSALVNPLARPVFAFALLDVTELLAFCCVVAGIAALFVRYARGSRLVRQQLLLLGAAVVLTLTLILAHPLLPEAVFQACMTLAPLSILGAVAFAVLRLELYDIDVLVSRVTLYAALTAALSAVFIIGYVSALAFASQLALGPSTWVAGAVGITFVVVCAEPMRRRLQRGLERRFLGERASPLAAMAQLRDATREHDSAAITSAIAQTIADAVRSPRVEIIVASVGVQRPGDPVDATLQTLVVPLLHRQERIGEVRVEQRSVGEDYRRRDRELLTQLADHAASILYGLRRDEELAAARRMAITDAADQRAQLGRDLHDAFGALLAGAGLTAEALRRTFPDGSAEERLAAQLAQQLRVAAGETRRIAHDLQPAALPVVDLATAIADHVHSLPPASTPLVDLRIAVEVLPRAVEQTAYFLVLEGLNNVIRHADASRVGIAIEQTAEALTIVVADDGVGLGTAYVSGVGMTSMRQRVEALSGAFSVSTASFGGTTLTACIPVSR